MLAKEYEEELSSIYDPGEVKQLFLMAYSFITGKKTIFFPLESRQEIQNEIQIRFLHILEELKKGKPIQHIIGEADFYGQRFLVNEHTLIPRPETEELVDWIISENRSKKDLSILDIGTGSGCIAISLAKHLPQARVHAIDVSAEAIIMARQNAKNQKVSIEFIEADILDWASYMSDNQQYDLIVSNPPYITPLEKEHMHINVLNYEPDSALFVEAHMPLLFYNTIADIGLHHLQHDGSIYVEINQYLSTETKDMFMKKGYSAVEIRKDLNTADRMIKTSLY